MENLWPKMDLHPMTTPKSILDKQAEYLQKMTNGVLSATVLAIDSIDPKQDLITYDFDIVCPSLNNLQKTLFSISHEVVALYPVDINFGIGYEAETEAEFIDAIMEVLKSRWVAEVITNLYNQSVS